MLPSGVNVITPTIHERLADDILLDGGCLVSEYEPFAQPIIYRLIEQDV